MTLIKWNPWNLPSMFDDDWDLPNLATSSRFEKGLNIYETDTTVVAEVSLPGIPEEKIDVSVDKGVVRVSASMDEKSEEKGKRKYYVSSMSQAYNYSFRLPEGLSDKDEPEASLENGVLTLTFKKAMVVPPKKLKITKKGK
jgi:HSP20 family protein